MCIAAMCAGLLFAVSSTVAWACSFGGTRPFVPTLDEWEQHPGPAQKDPNAGGDYWLPVPVPVVTLDRVTRGTAPPGASCADAGTVTLTVSLPKGSPYAIEDFGVYFRATSGESPDAIFPDRPMVGIVSDDGMGFLFAWMDGHPSQQMPLDLTVEVFLVANDLSVGRSTTFKVRADVGS